MVDVAPSRSLLVVQHVRGGHEVLDDVREAEVAIVKGLELDIVVVEAGTFRYNFFNFSHYCIRPGLADWDKRAHFLVIVTGQCRPKSAEQQKRNRRRLSQSASPVYGKTVRFPLNVTILSPGKRVTVCGHRMAHRKWKETKQQSKACCLAQLCMAAA